VKADGGEISNAAKLRAGLEDGMGQSPKKRRSERKGEKNLFC